MQRKGWEECKETTAKKASQTNVYKTKVYKTKVSDTYQPKSSGGTLVVNCENMVHPDARRLQLSMESVEMENFATCTPPS